MDSLNKDDYPCEKIITHSKVLHYHGPIRLEDISIVEFRGVKPNLTLCKKGRR